MGDGVEKDVEVGLEEVAAVPVEEEAVEEDAVEEAEEGDVEGQDKLIVGSLPALPPLQFLACP